MQHKIGVHEHAAYMNLCGHLVHFVLVYMMDYHITFTINHDYKLKTTTYILMLASRSISIL